MDGGRGRGRGWRIRSGMIPFLAISTVNEYWRAQTKPVVTAGLIAANTLIYLRQPGLVDQILPALEDVSFNPYLILKHRDAKRFLLSAFYHMGEPHLVYNMMSLLWKGVQLESSRGSLEYASMVATLLGLSQGITLLLAKGLVLFDYEKAYYLEHAVGFSGVLFAMKVVLNAESDEYTSVHGLIVPARYAAWAELVLIQMFVPGVSFLGHLGGILAGLVYLRWTGSNSGQDPLAEVIRAAKDAASWPLKFIWGLFRSRRGRITGRRTFRGDGGGVWRCPVCTYDNSERWNRCEMCEAERRRDNVRGGGQDLSLEELRLRRLERFGR